MDFYSGLLSFLADTTIRSLVLAAVAATAIVVFRVAAPGARHAVLTMAVIGMLWLAILGSVMPPVMVRILRTPAATAMPSSPPNPPSLSSAAAAIREIVQKAPAATEPRSTWPQVAVLLYGVVTLFLLARFVFGYLFTVRLVRAGRRLDDDWPHPVYESSWISVPLTVGWLRPKILLPAGWDRWSKPKLDAVMAHECTHIARADWAISILSGLNRCLLWFNPLAWWLERQLASLAEQACDDAALLQVESGHYAQALLEMAAAVKTGQGRLVWEAMAMAKAAEVRKRIERILDETRQIPRAFTGARWIALMACSLPLMYVTSAVRLAAQEPKTPAAMAEFLKGKRQLSAADVATMEQYLTANPRDFEVRSQLVVHYFVSGDRAPRFGHILWMVTNAPGEPAAAFVSQGISPLPNSLNDPSEYARIAALWRQQAAAHPKDVRVLDNAGQFFAQAGGDFEEAERYFLAERAIDQTTQPINRLADMYTRAILGATGDRSYARTDSSFADRVKKQLEESQDLILVRLTASGLANAARRPTPESPLRSGETNLNDHPLLQDAVEFGGRLMVRSESAATPVPTGTLRTVAPPASANRPVNFDASGLVAPQAATAAPQAPPPTYRVEAQYPALARQARIQGVVRMQAVIAGDGSISNLSVVSGHPLLVPAAIEAVKQWKFPGGTGGTYALSLPFNLTDAPALTPQTPQAGVTGGIQGGVVGGVPGGVANGIPQRIKVGGLVQASRVKERVEPEYPALARSARISGDVALEVEIGPDGRVESAKPVSGHPLLVGAARDAVLQWTFQPTTLNNTPVTVISVITVSFKLDQ